MLTGAAMARDYAVDRLDKFPMLTRVGANFNSLALFLVDVLQYFHWKRVMLIYNPQGHANEVRTTDYIFTSSLPMCPSFFQSLTVVPANVLSCNVSRRDFVCQCLSCPAVLHFQRRIQGSSTL